VRMYHQPVTMRRRLPRWAIGAFTVLLCSAAPVSADSEMACVRCTGPDQTYRCRAMSEDTVPSQALSYFCMSQIARDNVHESCAVVRNASQCDGRDVSYVYQDGVGDIPATAGTETPPAEKAPGTVADMTRSTVEATVKAGKAVGDATVKAGQAVGNATKRTLKCLGSALNGC
jgi:hypothetical protein